MRRLRTTADVSMNGNRTLAPYLAAICCLLLSSELAAQQMGPAPAQKTPFGPQAPYTKSELENMTPGSPNPYLSLLPEGVEPDWEYWQSWMAIEAQERRARMEGTQVVPKLLNPAESEPNDTQGTANFIAAFGTGAGDDPAADVTGDVPAPPAASNIGPFAEDDGSIPSANATGLSSGEAVSISGTIGDGPHGSGGSFNGDYDFFSIAGVTAGQTILVDVDTPDPFLPLDPFVSIWDSAGNLLEFGDDDFFGNDADGVSFDSFVEFVAPANGTYFVAIGGFVSFNAFPSVPANPFDSSSGPGAGSEGTYDMLIGLDYFDVDYFSFAAQAGDVFAVNGLNAARRVSVFSPAGELLIQSGQDLSAVYPGTSPLPGGGTGVSAYVLETTGTYAVRISGSLAGPYTAEMRVFRPVLESAGPAENQILLLDFDGATINTTPFGGPGVRSLSPLTFFLTGWGLGAADEDAVIDAIVASVQESLDNDLRFPFQPNPGFRVDVHNTRDHPGTTFGDPNVTRIIIGGSIAESGIATIGVAEFIDVGNFETEGTALVLLDVLSGPAPDPNSLNSVPRAMGVSIIDLIGVSIGNIVAHEAGHLFGNFHTDNRFTPPNIMDLGGNLPNTIGVGNDGIFGSGDDIDVDFGSDLFTSGEGFVGTEDTAATVAFGLTSAGGGGPIPLKAWPIAIGMFAAAVWYFIRRAKYARH